MTLKFYIQPRETSFFSWQVCTCFLIYSNWRITTLQYCDGFAIHQHEMATGIYVSPSSCTPPPHLPHRIPMGCPRAPALSALLHASNLHWSPLLHIKRRWAWCMGWELNPGLPRGRWEFYHWTSNGPVAYSPERPLLQASDISKTVTQHPNVSISEISHLTCSHWTLFFYP